MRAEVEGAFTLLVATKDGRGVGCNEELQPTAVAHVTEGIEKTLEPSDMERELGLIKKDNGFRLGVEKKLVGEGKELLLTR